MTDLLDHTVDLPALEAHLVAVEAAGGLLAVVVKRGGRADPPGTASSLARAREALRAGEPVAVQLRYRQADREWWDTILPAGPGGWRLVRIAHEG